MNKLKALLPVLLVFLLLLTVVPAAAEEAENLTGGLTVKTVDKPGKTGCITDGKYTTFWESSNRKNPWVVLSSDQPIYGLYLCFQKMPDTYVIQQQIGEDWITVAEGGEPRYHHAFFALNGVKKIRILSTMDKKNVMGFNEIYAFGEGVVPGWVQRWQAPAEKADLLILVAHPDDELLFTGGAIPVYNTELGRRVEVAYLTYSNTTRRSEALNGLWAMGVRHYPVFGGFADNYANTGKVKDAYKNAGGKEKVLDWVTELYRRFKPEVVITHAENGEYGHPQHKMVADAAEECFTQASDAKKFPDSYQAYGTWQVKKLYLHLYGEEAEQTVLDWDQPLKKFDGKTGAEIASEAFALHASQKGMGSKIKGKFVEFTVEETGAKMYPYDRFGLQNTTVGPDEAKNDFLEHIDAADLTRSGDTEETMKPETEEPEPDETETDKVEPAEMDADAEETDKDETENTEEPAASEDAGETEQQPEKTANIFRNVTAPEWADVHLNSRGFLDAGEYIFADDENGRYMYVNQTLRIVITRSIESPDNKSFYCFTTDIWCDTDAGELPTTVFKDPEKKKSVKDFVRNIAMENKAVFATTTDYYIYRIKADYPTGIEVRNGEVIFDDPHKLMYSKGSMPTYETLALYRDGHAESLPNKEKSAGEYVEEGAVQVYSFGPCLVKDGKLTEYSLKLTNQSYNPRLAIGVAEDGHYIVVMCEGRVKRSKGVQMADLAQIMLDRGCTLAVNMDGGQSAVVAFMGHQLNQVVSSDPNGREQADILTFSTSEQVGTSEMADEFKSKRKK